MASPFPKCNAQAFHPNDKGKAIMIYSLKHTATQRRPNGTGLFWKRRRGKIIEQTVNSINFTWRFVIKPIQI